ncbi:MAG: hypothetical protein ACYSUU_03290 [Planctomycetota bacterium]|jgi:hypothetical protein
MHRITRRLAGLIAISAASFAAIACTPYATFPPDGGSVVLTPGVYPVPQLMGKALSETYARTVGDLELVSPAAAEGEATSPPLIYALPSGISSSDWRQIGILTEVDSAREVTLADIDAGLPIWEIRQVRVRSNRAEVDVAYPSSGDLYQLATLVYLSEPFRAYQLDVFQRWLIPADRPTCVNPDEIARVEAEEAAAEAAAAAAQAEAEAEQAASENANGDEAGPETDTDTAGSE